MVLSSDGLDLLELMSKVLERSFRRLLTTAGSKVLFFLTTGSKILKKLN